MGVRLDLYTGNSYNAALNQYLSLPRESAMRPDQIQPEMYEKQLQDKQSELAKLMATLSLPEMEVFASKPSHYRMRAEFRIWHDGDDLYYAMFDPADPRTPIRTDQFLAASDLINELMPKLLDAVRDVPVLRYKLFQTLC